MCAKILVFVLFFTCADAQYYSYSTLMKTLYSAKAVNDLNSYVNLSAIVREGVEKLVPTGVVRQHLLTTDYPVSEACMNQTLLWLDRVAEIQPWAMAVLDAVGKPPSAMALGGFQWLGSYDECQHVSNMTKEFDAHYCLAQMTFRNPFPREQLNLASLTLDWGTCFSKNCSDEDVRSLILVVLSLVPISSLHFEEVYCQPDMFDLNFSPLTILSICTLGFLYILVGIGTVYDLCRRRLSAGRAHCYTGTVNANVSPRDNRYANGATGSVVANVDVNGDVNGRDVNLSNEDIVIGIKDTNVASATSASTSDVVIHLQDNTHTSNDLLIDNSADVIESTAEPVDICGRILMSFSMPANAQRVFNTQINQGSDQNCFSCLHGIRFITMTWVILGHTYYFAITSGLTSNLVLVQTMLNRWTFLTVLNSTLAGDTFFLLSGTLVSYMTLRHLKRNHGRVNWFVFIIHRYFRLTPAFMLLMVIYIGLFQIWSDGPVFPRRDYGFDPNCRTNWWTNLLYVSNIVHSDEQCMGWGWYLACDMQFYVLSPIVILLFHYSHWSSGAVACLSLVLVQCISTGIIARQHDLDMTYQSLFRSWDYIYWKPWCRVGVYAIGLFLGYALNVAAEKSCQVKKFQMKTNAFGWILAFVCCMTAVNGPFQSYHSAAPSLDLSAIYLATFRVLWGLGVAWVVYACATGNGGVINCFLSWRAFVPLSRLTFTAYLVHPFVIQMYLLSLRTSIYINDFTAGYLWLGHLVVSFVFAFAASMILEAPFVGISNALFAKCRVRAWGSETEARSVYGTSTCLPTH